MNDMRKLMEAANTLCEADFSHLVPVWNERNAIVAALKANIQTELDDIGQAPSDDDPDVVLAHIIEEIVDDLQSLL